MPRHLGMESKDSDRSNSGFPQTLGAVDAKPAQPQSSVKTEVCLEIWLVLPS